ncbi:hypothetical protein L198_06248 [Cryptococcus wingfieldii CBS 7118]|uniref:Uncharacterized protein n=1 Tax=Cryptococcus wingfieldii CBS 7118 TaxID=1295528 RepID=A0A1E3INP8_9TREE|nr:hypothetical protein L198_06248 [Cryptococcus wingfieldii CBS 7118]ODN90230.1 hypothetical protein L198_06248 [Cryptococcus wingfieldii CBS 7118]
MPPTPTQHQRTPLRARSTNTPYGRSATVQQAADKSPTNLPSPSRPLANNRSGSLFKPPMPANICLPVDEPVAVVDSLEAAAGHLDALERSLDNLASSPPFPPGHSQR